MRFAAFADIHGNALALKAVLDDMHTLGIRQAVNLGDVFSGPLDAAATAALLQERDIPTIRGNHDRYLIEQNRADMGPSDQVAFDQLGPAQFEWIAGLPPTRTVFDEVFLCHGTPSSDGTYWLDRISDTGVPRPATLDEVRAEAKGIDAPVILCAHTHIPRSVRLPDGRLIVNPGSIGCPAYDDDLPVYHHMQTGTPDASYAILEKAGAGWRVTFRNVPYDNQSASDMAARRGRPDWARALSTGWFEA